MRFVLASFLALASLTPASAPAADTAETTQGETERCFKIGDTVVVCF